MQLGFWTMGVLSGIVGLKALQEPTAKQPVTGRIDWVYDYAEGKRLGLETGKPLWVVFRCER